jgi:flagellar basal-body rod modification protein FlgD
MSTVNSTQNNVTQYTGNTSTNAGGQAAPNGDVLSQSDFLNLLVAQLQNQDPTDPESDTDFAAQMAQFSTLDTMDSLNSTMDDYTQYSEMAQGASLIGATVSTTATDASGNLISGVVSSVGVSNGAVSLNVDGTSVPLSDVTGVSPTTTGV